MALAEKLFLHDSLACLDLMEAERQGLLAKTRREWSLLMTERLLDLLGFDRAQRLAFYAVGYRWTREMGTWKEAELETIEKRYQDAEAGPSGSLHRRAEPPPRAALGGRGAGADRPSGAWRRAAPVVAAILEAHAAGRIHQDLAELAWSYAHMHCNRLGIDPTPEALLRYFMHRLVEDGGGAA